MSKYNFMSKQSQYKNDNFSKQITRYKIAYKQQKAKKRTTDRVKKNNTQ